MKSNFDSNHALSNKDLLELIHNRLEGLIVLAEAHGLKQEVYLLDQCQMDLLKLHGEY